MSNIRNEAETVKVELPEPRVINEAGKSKDARKTFRWTLWPTRRICKIFGHQPPVYAPSGWFHPGQEYGRMTAPVEDGIGRRHYKVLSTCPRCGEEFRLCRVRFDKKNVSESTEHPVATPERFRRQVEQQTERREKNLRRDIEHAINCNSAENGSDTPDFILAEYLTNCLAAYDRAVTAREKWYGRGTKEQVETPIA